MLYDLIKEIEDTLKKEYYSEEEKDLCQGCKYFEPSWQLLIKTLPYLKQLEEDEVRLSCLQIPSMLLSKYSQDPPKDVRPIENIQEMAKYFKLLIDSILPEDMRYKEEN